MMQFNMGYRSKKQVRRRAGAVPSVHTASSLGPGQPVFGRRRETWCSRIRQRCCSTKMSTVRLVFWHLTAYTPNGDDDVMEAKWKSMVSSECDLNLCLLLPAYASVWERNTAGHHRLHENTALSCLLLHLLLFPDPSRGSTRWGCWRVSSTAFTI